MLKLSWIYFHVLPGPAPPLSPPRLWVSGASGSMQLRQMLRNIVHLDSCYNLKSHIKIMSHILKSLSCLA